MAGKVIICDNNVSASGGGRGLKTVELSIEYIEQNCRVIELSSDVLRCRIVQCGGESHHMR